MSRNAGPQPLPHRLAALWFADIVEYSTLLGEDEDATLELVRCLQGAARAAVQRYEGRLVKFTGDGALAEFPSTERAVRAAFLLQTQYRDRSSTETGSAGDLRIGVHLGEVATGDDGDLYGAGVNAAARIQREAAPGQVLVSDDVWRQLHGRPDFHFGEANERELKGVGRLGLRPVELERRESGQIRDRPGPAPKSIAVLPFVNMSPDPENAYFSDGMTEELIIALSRVPELRVPARTSSFAFKDCDLDVREIGRRLGVEHVLEGSVRKSGKKLRITAQLAEVAGGFHLWSDTYDRELQDVFAIQEEISRTIVDALKIRLAGPADLSLSHRGTMSVEAYTLYLKGRFYLNKRTRQAYRQAIPYFERAIEVDPSYALAYSGLADLHLLLERYTVLPPREAIPRAKAAAEKAVEIDDTLPEAHNSLAYARMIGDWDWRGATREFERAIECGPWYAPAHHWYGWQLMQLGRLDESLAQVRRALELEPLSLIFSANIGTILYIMRRYDDAIEQLQRTLELDTDFVVAHQWLGRAFEQKAMHAEAVAAHRRALNLLGGEDPESIGSLGHALALAGQHAEARKAIQRLEALAGRQFVSRYWMGLVYLGLGEADQALVELERAYEERFDWILFLNVEPMFDPLRSEPRFIRLVRGMGLEPPGLDERSA